MICHFCKVDIHFFEDFYVISGFYFHVQTLINGVMRCKRLNNKRLETIEHQILEDNAMD